MIRLFVSRFLRVAAAALFFVAGAATAQTVECENPTARCGALLSASCLNLLGAGAISAGSPCEDQAAAYRGCLSDVAARCPTLVGQGGRSDTATRDLDVFCQSEVDGCLAALDQDYRDCRTGAGGEELCRSDCRDERDVARDRCNDGLRSCLATGDYQTARFVFPDCAESTPFSVRDARSGDETPTPDPQTTPQIAPPIPTPPLPTGNTVGIGTVCRNAQFYCFMTVPGPVNGVCTCTGNPMMGIPPFQGLITFQ